MITEKICNTCFERKPLEEFYQKAKARRHIGDGRENKCKECTKFQARSPKSREMANKLRRGSYKNLSEEQKKAHREYNKEYFKTDRGREIRRKTDKKRRADPEKRESEQRRAKIYRKTEAFKRSVEKYRQTYPERREAHIQVAKAFQCGKITRPGRCSVCGKKCTPQAHHPDYSKPLEVIWVCRRCHVDFHWSM